MDIVKKITASYPEIDPIEFIFGKIRVQDDGDGVQYIAKWDYSKPIPEGLTLGKPSAQS
jgi:hypothetical protein